MQFGLIGKKLGHSYSKVFFKEFFKKQDLKYSYELFELEDLKYFPKLIKDNPQLRGLNVTIPYKSQILNYVDKLDQTVKIIGASNCLLIEEGKIHAFNTDIYGFSKSFHKEANGNKFSKALILGNGGVSRAVRYVLENENIICKIVSRQKQDNCYTYEILNAGIVREHLLIIQCTPVGMYPHIENCPVFPYQHLTQEHLVIDLIYNPKQSKFLQLAQSQGAKTANGLDMFKEQALESWRIWQSRKT